MLFLQTADSVNARPLSWLWPGRLAQGKLSILDGDPGLGKSLLALDLCARISTGRDFPDGGRATEIGNAIYLNAEDGAQDTIRPRLRAFGADLRRIFLLEAAGPPDLLSLPRETAQLREALRQTQARCVVLDPVVSFLDASVSEASNQSIRRALQPLADLAERHDASILLIRHLNKRRGGRSLYRGSGSIGFVGACRSAWLVAADPTDPSRRVLAQVKNNLAPPQPSLAFCVGSRADGEPELRWLGHTDWSADELLGGETSARDMPARDQACLFLTRFLKHGPRRARDLWEAAKAQGLSERTLFRARGKLDIRITRKYEGPRPVNYWSLPEHSFPVRATSSDTPILDAMLADLQKQFPTPTPLDDDDV